MTSKRQQTTWKSLAAMSVLALAGALPAAADERIRGEYKRTLMVSDPVTVVVRNLVGDFDLRAGAAGQLQIHATISAGTQWDCDPAKSAARVKQFEEHPAVRVEAGTVYIGVWDDMSNHHCTSAAYAISVPANSKLEVETRIGSVTVFDIAGPIRVKTGIGGIRLQDPGASVEARTATGSIYVAGKPTGDWTLDAGTGGVELRIPRGAGFRLDAESESPLGAFKSDFSQQVRLSPTARDGRSRVQESYNEGGPLVRVRVAMGSIRIFER